MSIKRTAAGIALAFALASVSAAATATPAAARVTWSARPVHDTAGPGLKNWQCRDRDSSWRGAWRYTKSGAFLDCESYNIRA